MGKKITVLVVDDEKDFRDLMTFWLESKGYAVLQAADGKTAIDQVQRDVPDIVFLDLYMPVMDGAETLRKIRKRNRGIPVILISAYVDDPKVTKVLDYGVSGVFYKTTDFEEHALSLLESALRAHKKLKRNR
jgi:two-component system response regulator (stage 0 sporulation protein F)